VVDLIIAKSETHRWYSDSVLRQAVDGDKGEIDVAFEVAMLRVEW
jgi:hypothetical protein